MVDEVADESQRLLARLRSSAGRFGFLGLLIVGLGLLADGSSPVWLMSVLGNPLR